MNHSLEFFNKSRNKICKYPTITYKEITNVPRVTAKGNEQTQSLWYLNESSWALSNLGLKLYMLPLPYPRGRGIFLNWIVSLTAQS